MRRRNFNERVAGLGLAAFTLLAAPAFGAAWQKVPGNWMSVSAQNDGTALALDGLGNLQRTTGAASTAVSSVVRLIGGSGTGAPVYQLAGKSSSVFVVNQGAKGGLPDPNTGAIYQVDSASGAPSRVPGTARAAMIASDGTAYAVANGALYRSCVCGRAGETAQFKWMMVSAFGPNADPLSVVALGKGIWALTTHNKVLRWNTAKLDWDSIDAPAPGLATPPTLVDLSVADDGTVVGLQASGRTLTFVIPPAGQPSYWKAVNEIPASSQPLVHISASGANVYWGISAAQELFVYR